MVNPATMVKLMGAKNKFSASHPKFVAFLKAVFSKGIIEGTVVEISITRPGEETITSNIKINESDLELFDSLKNLQ
ncbi:MAG: hypothetical protein ACI4E1_06370 [Lachnospira sp.]